MSASRVHAANLPECLLQRKRSAAYPATRELAAPTQCPETMLKPFLLQECFLIPTSAWPSPTPILPLTSMQSPRELFWDFPSPGSARGTSTL